MRERWHNAAKENDGLHPQRIIRKHIAGWTKPKGLGCFLFSDGLYHSYIRNIARFVPFRPCPCEVACLARIASRVIPCPSMPWWSWMRTSCSWTMLMAHLHNFFWIIHWDITPKRPRKKLEGEQKTAWYIYGDKLHELGKCRPPRILTMVQCWLEAVTAPGVWIFQKPCLIITECGCKQ